MNRKQNDRWVTMFQELQTYHSTHGDCLVPQKFHSNPKLGSWVDRQRQLYKLRLEEGQSPLNDERIAALNSLNFSWMPIHDEWQIMFDALKKYYIDNGDYRVPARCSINPKLGRWVNTQRKMYNQVFCGSASSNESFALSPFMKSRFTLLESIGFTWSVTDKNAWYTMFHELQEFRDQHGHCLVPNRYLPNRKLGGWVKRQRHCYKLFKQGKASSMTKKRFAALNSIGFSWNAIRGGITDIARRRDSTLNRKLSLQEEKFIPKTLSNEDHFHICSETDETYAGVRFGDGNRNGLVVSPEPDEIGSDDTRKLDTSLTDSKVWRCDSCYNAFFYTESEAWAHAAVCFKKAST